MDTFSRIGRRPIKTDFHITYYLINSYTYLHPCETIARRQDYGRWAFVVDTDIQSVNLQLLAFYIGYFGSKLPSAVFAGFIIASSSFRKPLIISFLVCLAFQIILLTIRTYHRGIIGLYIHQNTAFYMEIIIIFLLACASSSGAWFIIGPIGRFVSAKFSKGR
jgi:hypothetical protein